MVETRTPSLAVDIVILLEEGLLLIRRENPPYQGSYALPGGFVEVGERVEDAARREAKEETGMDLEDLRLVGVFSDPRRDPRGHVVSICFLACGRGKPKAGSDACATGIFPLDRLPPLAFDHEEIIREALKVRRDQVNVVRGPPLAPDANISALPKEP